MDRQQKINLLIELLLDKDAPLADRDDAAMDLGLYPDKKVLKALILVASDPTEDFISDVAGESIGQIWIALDSFNIGDYMKLMPLAKREALAVIKKNKPEWVIKFNLSG